MLIRAVADVVVKGLGQSHLEVFEEQLSTQRHTLDEHIDVHEAQRLSVHVEAFGADGRKAVHLLQVPQPHQDVLT